MAPSPQAPLGTARSGRRYAILGAALLGTLILVAAGLPGASRSGARRNVETPGGSPRRAWASRTTKTVQLKVGTATITDDRSGTSHVRIACNNGLTIDADWKRNPYNEFGYDIYEPTVDQNYNRLAVMMTARGVIAAYIRGEYD